MADSSDTDIDVRALSDALGMTQEEFARAVGVSFTTVSRWETGRGRPSPLALRRPTELSGQLTHESPVEHVQATRLHGSAAKE